MGHTTWVPHIANDDQLINWLKKWKGFMKIKFSIEWHCTQVELKSNSTKFNWIKIQLYSKSTTFNWRETWCKLV